MRRKPFYLCLLGIGVIGLILTRPPTSSVPSTPPGVIEYRGESFKLSKSYDDYDDYKDDPNNLDPSENARVERAVTQAQVSRGGLSRAELIREALGLGFPGYGMAQFGEKPQPDGTSLAVYSVEIPRADKDRVLVFHGRGDVYTLIDDFVVSNAVNPVMQVRREGGQLIFSTLEDKQVLARPFAGDRAESRGEASPRDGR